ncbi:Cytochrome P450 monooxygenase, partial [Pseudocercospora fuligena]
QRFDIGFRQPNRTLNHPGPNEGRCAERSALAVEIHIHVVIEVFTCFELSPPSCVAVMMPYSATLILACVAAAFLARAIFIALHSPLNRIPGPWIAKFSNIRLKLAVISGRRIHYIDALHKKYGPFVRISPDEIAVNDSKAIKQIHGIGSGFEKSSWYDTMVAMERPTLFTMTDGKSHAARRKLLARGFSKSNIRQNWEGVMRQKVVLAVDKIRDEAARNGGMVDVLKWWTFMASDVSSHLILGEDFHTLERGEVNDYMRILTKALRGAGIGAELPLLRSIGQRLPFQFTQKLWNTNEFLDDYAKVAVRNMQQSGQSKNVFANISAEAEKGDIGTLDLRDVELEASALFVAGTDTTAVSLSYVIYAVLARPDLRRRLEAEVAELPDNFQDADLEKLPLLHAVIEETLRLYGAAPGMLPRVVPAGGFDMGDYYIPQGTTVTTHAYSIHRDPAIFPDPLEFKPSRFLPESEDKLSDAAKAVYMPFGAGSRTCLGLHIAYGELRLATAEFFRRCPGSRLAESTTEDVMEFENFFLIAPRGHKCEVVIDSKTFWA